MLIDFELSQKNCLEVSQRYNISYCIKIIITLILFGYIFYLCLFAKKKYLYIDENNINIERTLLSHKSNLPNICNFSSFEKY